MVSRRIKGFAAVLVLTGGLGLGARPAEAGERPWRFASFNGIARHVREVGEQGPVRSITRLLRRLFQGSGGGMDPNGNPDGGK